MVINQISPPRFWSPETSDWETFRSQLSSKGSSEMKVDNSSTNSKFNSIMFI